MTIEKLIEFAKNGSKNKDELDIDIGFVVSRKPARQWFNYLFNMLSLKVNEIIDLDPIARADLVNDLTTGGIDKAITAEAVKQFKNAFKSSKSQNGHIEIPCADGVPIIIQWSRAIIPSYRASVDGILPVVFPNAVLGWVGSVTNGIAPTIYIDSVVTRNAFSIRSDKVLGAGAIACTIFAVGF